MSCVVDVHVCVSCMLPLVFVPVIVTLVIHSCSDACHSHHSYCLCYSYDCDSADHLLGSHSYHPTHKHTNESISRTLACMPLPLHHVLQRALSRRSMRVLCCITFPGRLYELDHWKLITIVCPPSLVPFISSAARSASTSVLKFTNAH